MARRYRPRKEFKFWLYHDLADDLRLMEYIAYLYKTRQFAATVRNGLRLMWTLREGNLAVLFELFPTLRNQLSQDNSALIQEFRRILASQTHDSNGMPHPEQNPALPGPRSSPGLRPLLPLIETDDDQDTLILSRSASTDASKNFLAGLTGLAGQ